MRRFCLVLALLLMCTALSGCFLFPRRGAKSGGGTAYTAAVSGVITDSANQPLSGAKVTVLGSEQTSITGPDGKYTVTGLGEGFQTLSIFKEGYLAGAITTEISAGGRSSLEVPPIGLPLASGSLHGDSTRVPPVQGKGACAQCHQLHTPTDYAPNGAMNDSCFQTSGACHGTVGVRGGFSRSVYDASPHGPTTTPDVGGPTPVWSGQKTSSRGNCGTCHEPHGIAGTPPFMLRAGAKDPDGTLRLNALCLACHQAAGVGKTITWPGQSAYLSAANLHAYPTKGQMSYPGTTYGKGECGNCHVPHGKTNAGGDTPHMLRDQGYVLCHKCHTDPPSCATPGAGHDNCLLCHDPHRVEHGKVKNPANPSGPLYTVPKDTYRGNTMIKNDYCLLCHKTPPPAGYGAAKDPSADTTGFTNVEVANKESGRSAYPPRFDRNLHRVHASKIQADQEIYRDPDTGNRVDYWHPYWPFLGDVNTVRCVTCHSVHQISSPQNVLTSATGPLSKASGGGYNGKAGCSSPANDCHKCEYCHGPHRSPVNESTKQAGPGGPGIQCTYCADHSTSPGYHGVKY